MKRSTHEGSAVVYQYGTPHWADLDEEGIRQLWLANGLRNKFVEIERRDDAKIKEAEKTIPSLAEAELAVQQANALVTNLKARLMQERIMYRTTKVLTKTPKELKTAREALHAATAHRNAIKQETKDTIRPLRAELKEARKLETGTDFYGAWTERGLGWGTFNGIKNGIETTREQIIHLRTLHEPAEFNFHRWQGEGTLHVQCQQMAGKERRVEWEIVGDHPKHKTLRLRIGRARGLEPYWLEIPFVYHRPLPCSPQDVTDVQVTRRVVGGQSRITIQFSCRVPVVKPRTAGTVVTLQIGWKRLDDGIRVGTAMSWDPFPPVPVGLREVVRLTTKHSAQIVLPNSYILFDPDPDKRRPDPEKRPFACRPDAIRAARDQSIEELRPFVLEAMKEDVIRDLIQGNPALWKSPARFASLAKRIPREHSLHPVMEKWRKRDLHLWSFEANERDQMIARRRDTYRKVAAWLVQEAKRVTISGSDYAEIKQRPNESNDTHEAKGGRRQLQQVAPGELRLYVEQAARKHGVEMQYAEGERQSGDADLAEGTAD